MEQRWDVYYRDQVAKHLNVDLSTVRIVCRHDPVIGYHEGQEVASGFCVELTFEDGNGTHTVFAWDEMGSFLIYRKNETIRCPGDALVAFVAERHRRRQGK